MKKILFLTILFALSLTQMSCSKDDSEQNEGGDESGMLWGIGETAVEVVNGIKLTLTYNVLNSTFEGTLENLNTTTMPQVRVEVHVFDLNDNSTEFGPTTPIEMIPGQISNVILPITLSTNFVQFNMHPEVGSSGD